MTEVSDPRPPAGSGRIPVGGGMEVLLSLAERVLLATSPAVRMARLRQTGLAWLSVPASEHSRFVHCLGTIAWTSTLLEGIARDAAVAPVDMDGIRRIARMYAAVHDCGLLPLGHTLTHQLGFADPRVAVDRMLLDHLAVIRAEVPAVVASLVAPSSRERLTRSMDDDLDVVQQVVAGAAREPSWGPQRVVADAVTGPLSADLLDYATRDLAAAGMTWRPEPPLLDRITLLADPADPQRMRLGVAGGGAELARALCEVMEARLSVARELFLRPTKLIADAMLDLALRRIDAHTGDVTAWRGDFAPERLVCQGDDEFLDRVVHHEVAALAWNAGDSAARALLGRRSYEIIAELEGPPPPAAERLMRSPAERTRVEQRIRARAGLEPNAPIAISCPPPAMQFKRADVLVSWNAAPPLLLEDLARSVPDLARIAALRDRYRALWRARVVAAPAIATERIRAAAREILGSALEVS